MKLWNEEVDVYFIKEILLSSLLKVQFKKYMKQLKKDKGKNAIAKASQIGDKPKEVRNFVYIPVGKNSNKEQNQ